MPQKTYLTRPYYRIITTETNNSYTFNSLQLSWAQSTLVIALATNSPKTECFLALKCYFEHPNFQCSGLYLVYMDDSNIVHKERQSLNKILKLDYAGFLYGISERSVHSHLGIASGEYDTTKLHGLELRDLSPIGLPNKLGIEGAAKQYITLT